MNKGRGSAPSRWNVFAECGYTLFNVVRDEAGSIRSIMERCEGTTIGTIQVAVDLPDADLESQGAASVDLSYI